MGLDHEGQTSGGPCHSQRSQGRELSFRILLTLSTRKQESCKSSPKKFWGWRFRLESILR
eukprot:384873-Hanusia_phi.AAC.1